ncbi:serine threonine- kinase endoribonuclease IRE1-like isoform X2 [Paramuricea clavata]|uniref:Serine threonine- kinase endoribonuclease IRE1-like isoform X2 n=1 Tax=Paramuricea clavata TaxID=317549 RepID=A0A6S7G1V9_PARCT|nr:serine threonine- kinase endoribonuclease IRE1-like isoform X2 [Paramuricea clavata]
MDDESEVVVKRMLTQSGEDAAENENGILNLIKTEILHKDLKPLNIFVDIEGRMRLANFAISRVLKEDEATDFTDPKGTPNWMPAEVIESINRNEKCRFKKKSDVQVAGMIALFISTQAKHPFGFSPDCMGNILKGNPVNLGNLDDLHARQFITRLISHEINDRPYAHEALEHSFLNNNRYNFCYM